MFIDDNVDDDVNERDWMDQRERVDGSTREIGWKHMMETHDGNT
jgi:hypothetical protein